MEGVLGPADGERRPPLRIPRAVDYAVVGMAVLAGYLFVWPVGEYAFLDDWAYVRSLKLLHERGVVRIMEFNPMSLVGHLFWGVLFTKLCGFSFTVARISVTALQLLEGFVFLRFLHLLNVGRTESVAVTLALMLHPLHFFHCHTFMTDVPALAWQLLAMYFFARAMVRTGFVDCRWFALGSLTSGYAFLCRQNAVMVLAAVTLWALSRGRRRMSPGRWCALLIPATVTMGLFSWWYYEVHGPTQLHQLMGEAARAAVAEASAAKLTYVAFSLSMYLGLAVGPVALAVFSHRRRPGESWVVAAGGAAVAWLLFQGLLYYGADGRVFPYLHNVVSRYGFLGPSDFLIGGRTALYGSRTGWALGGLLAVAAAIFVGRTPLLFHGHSRPSGERDVVVCLLLWIVLQSGYFLVMSTYLFDRHLVVLVPPALLILAVSARTLPAWNWAAYAICMLPMTYYSLAGTRDLHAVSREAFQLGGALIARGVESRNISAGYAFDCWHNYENQPFDPTRPPARVPGWWLNELLPEVDPVYVVSFSPRIQTGDGIGVREVRSVETLLPPGTEELYLLELSR